MKQHLLFYTLVFSLAVYAPSLFGQNYNVTLTQCNSVNNGAETFNFLNAPTPAGDGILTIEYGGDFSTVTTEFVDLLGEGGYTFATGLATGNDCGSNNTETYVIPLAQLITWTNDQTITITVDGTNATQLTGTLCSCTLGGNMAFEAEINIEYPPVTAPDNAGITAIVNPTETFCGGSEVVEVVATNLGTNQITPVTIEWAVDGVAQTPYTYTGVLDTVNGTGLQSATIILGSYVFSGQTELSVWTTMPNGVNDTINGDDTSKVAWFAPNPELDIEDVVLCEGGLGVLSTGSWDQVSWTTGEALEDIIVTEAGVYGVTVTDEYGCSDEDQILVSVEEDPSAEFSEEEESCGEMVLNAGTSGNTYAWSTGETTQVISVTQTGGYVVTITTAQGCIGVDETNVTILALPNANLGEDFTLCVDYPSSRALNVANIGSDYIWSTGETTGEIVVDGAGKSAGATQLYSVTVTDENGCENTGMVTASFQKCVPEAVNEIGAGEGFSFYPNPATSSINLQFAEEGKFEVQLIDANGRVLMNEVASGNNAELNLQNIASGAYHLRVKGDEDIYLKQIIIQ